MASIDDGSTVWTFLTLSGAELTEGEQLETITRSGSDGAAFRKTGIRARPYQMTSVVDVDTAADCKVELDSYFGVQGSLVTVIDDLGNEYTNVAVLDVQPVRQMVVAGMVGGLSTSMGAIVEALWTFQDTGV